MYEVVQIGTDCGGVNPETLQQPGVKWMVVDSAARLEQYKAKTRSVADTLQADLDNLEDKAGWLPAAELYVVRLALLSRKDEETVKQLLLQLQRKAMSLRIRLLNMKEQPQLTERGLRLAWSTWPELTSPVTYEQVLTMLTDNQRTLNQNGEISAVVQAGALLRHLRSTQVVSVNDPPDTRGSTRAQTLLPEREGQLKIPIPLTYRLEASV